jgi:hypothetical protein
MIAAPSRPYRAVSESKVPVFIVLNARENRAYRGWRRAFSCELVRWYARNEATGQWYQAHPAKADLRDALLEMAGWYE